MAPHLLAAVYKALNKPEWLGTLSMIKIGLH